MPHHSPRRLSPSSNRKSHHPRSSCTLYTNPTSTSTLAVFSPLTISWDPSCLTLTTSTISLYLEVVSALDGTAEAVHKWTGIEYGKGSLETTLDPGWWNASTGAGQVDAQFLITETGAPIWDTAAPVGPSFVIAYNGSYPSVTTDASLPAYTGPSVESVSNGSSSSSSSLSGGKLVAAVAIPLLVVILSLCGYVGWNRWRKRPEQKRWSAVIDQRMSMISQGTFAPPGSRPSSHYSQLGRPSSHFSSHDRPSGSISRSPLAPPGSPLATPPKTHHAGPSSLSLAHSHHRAPSSATSLYSLNAPPSPRLPASATSVGDRNSKRSFSADARPSSLFVPTASRTRKPSAASSLNSPTLASPSSKKLTHLATSSTSSFQLQMNELNFPALAIVCDPGIRFSMVERSGDSEEVVEDPFKSPAPSVTSTERKRKEWMPMMQKRGSVATPDEMLKNYAKDKKVDSGAGGSGKEKKKWWSRKKGAEEKVEFDDAGEKGFGDAL